jgi:hypothetical protein
MFGIKNLVAHNPETVKSWGKVFFSLVKNVLGEKEQKATVNEDRETDDH